MTLWFSVKSIVVRCLIYLASIKIVQCFKQPEDKLEKSEQHSFKRPWYKDFPWIHRCISCKKVFCYYCLKCYETGLITFTKYYETAFIVEGFHNWKRAVEHLIDMPFQNVTEKLSAKLDLYLKPV